jgi:PEP-CTERM motif-containing protein
MKLIWLTAIFSLTTLPALCDSVPFTVDAVQPGGVVILEPTGNPLLQPSFCLPICVLEFDTALPNATTPTVYTFSLTFTLGGQPIPSNPPFTLTCSPQVNNGACGVVSGFFIPDCCKGSPIVNGTFTAAVNGISETFNYRLQEVNPNVTPEPASICLLGTGLVAIGWKRFRRK